MTGRWSEQDRRTLDDAMGISDGHYRSADDAAAAAGLLILLVLVVVALLGFAAGFAVRAVLG